MAAAERLRSGAGRDEGAGPEIGAAVGDRASRVLLPAFERGTMRNRHVGLLTLIALLVACPRDREPELARDTLDAAPQAVTPAHDPGARPEAARTIELAPLSGEALSAEAAIVPIGVQTQITVHVRQAPPNTSLTAHVVTGTCERPGPMAADLQPIVTDGGGMGTGRIVVDLSPEVIVNGNHSIQLRRQNGQEGIAVACGEISAHPVLQPED
jgi:hypothetical protein